MRAGESPARLSRPDLAPSTLFFFSFAARDMAAQMSAPNRITGERWWL